MNDLEGVFEDSNRHQFLAVVSAVHHQRVHKAFHDWALRLAESLHLVSPARVRQVLSILLLYCYVILQNELEFRATVGIVYTYKCTAQ